MNRERISVSEKKESISIIIFPLKDKRKQAVLFAWLLLWTAGGAIIMAELLFSDEKEKQLFGFIWTGFWIYFEALAMHAFLWRQYGFEQLLIKNEKLFYKRNIRGWGKSRNFNIDFIKNIEEIEYPEKSFIKLMSSAYWQVAGETVKFLYNGREILLGLQLGSEDVKKLLNLFRQHLK